MPLPFAEHQSIQDLLSSYPDEQGCPEGAQFEISLPARDDPGSEREVLHYTLETSPLKDWRSREVGRVLLLHAVMAQTQA